MPMPRKIQSVKKRSRNDNCFLSHSLIDPS